jgi:hypothetical protein
MLYIYDENYANWKFKNWKYINLKSWKVKQANMNLKPHNEGYHMIMSLHLHYLVDKIVQLPSRIMWSLFVFMISSNQMIFNFFHLCFIRSCLIWDQLKLTDWKNKNSYIQDLVEILRKESIKNAREGFTNDNPCVWMTKWIIILET